MDTKIILKKTTIEGVYFGEINHFQDHRGKFMRLYDYKEISKKLNQPIVEVNLSQNNFSFPGSKSCRNRDKKSLVTVDGLLLSKP